jgi:hypothetical protein
MELLFRKLFRFVQLFLCLPRDLLDSIPRLEGLPQPQNSDPPLVQCPQNQMLLRIVEVDDRPFLISPKSFSIKLARYGDQSPDLIQNAVARPATVLSVDSDYVIDSRWLNQRIEDMLAKDDVFNHGFYRGCSSGVLFQVTRPLAGLSLTEDAEQLLDSWGALSYCMSDENKLPDGPYFLANSTLFEALRIYPDPQQAFMYGTLYSDTDGRK